MLGAMEIPWLVLGVVIGVGLVLLAGLVAALVLRRRSGGPAPARPMGFEDDDLPGFRDSPPGSTAAAPGSGWAVLAPAPPPTNARLRPRRDTVVVAGGMAGIALLLL